MVTFTKIFVNSVVKKKMKLDKSLVTVKWLNEHLDDQNLVILDGTINKVISNQSLKIKNARFFDIKQKFSDTKASFPNTLPTQKQFETETRQLGIDNSSAIVVYDDRGIYSSARVWWLFHLFGFENIAVLDGGFPLWNKRNFEIEPYDSQSFNFGNFNAKFDSDKLIKFEEIIHLQTNDNYQIIDVRSEERFLEKIDEPREGLRRGKIPNSINLPYEYILENGKLKSKKELIDIFKVLNFKNKTLIFSCGSGVTACIAALAANLIGINNYMIYDGSWTEYGTLTN